MLSTRLSAGDPMEQYLSPALGLLVVWWGTDQYIIHLRALTLWKCSGGIRGGLLEKVTAKLRLEGSVEVGKEQEC